MAKTSFARERNLRKERNTDVIRRMRNGDQLSSFNSYSSWFPPRPVVEKDTDAVKKLYGQAPRPIRNVKPVKKNDSVREEIHKLRLA